MTHRPKNVESWILVQIQVTIGTQVHDTFFLTNLLNSLVYPVIMFLGGNSGLRGRDFKSQYRKLFELLSTVVCCVIVLLLFEKTHTKWMKKEAEDLEWFFRRNLFSMQRLALALAFVKYGVKKLQLRFCVHLLMPFQQQQQQPWRQQLNNKNNNNATWIKKEKKSCFVFQSVWIIKTFGKNSQIIPF